MKLSPIAISLLALAFGVNKSTPRITAHRSKKFNKKYKPYKRVSVDEKVSLLLTKLGVSNDQHREIDTQEMVVEETVS